MKTKLFAASILTMLMLCTGIIMFAGASDLPNLRLPDDPITMTVYDDDISYFDINLSDVLSDLDVGDGYYDGWCADRSVVMPRGERLTVRLYNSYDLPSPSPLHEKNWSKVNYILNHKDSATKIDIQDAFWYLLCNYPYASLTNTAKILVDTADGWFIPQPGDIIAVLAAPVYNESNPWPFQYAFLEVIFPPQEPIEKEIEEPIQTTTFHSHGFHYNDITPIANANGPYNALPNEEIIFNGSASYDPDGLIILFRWSFGDGTLAEGKTITHAYTNQGIYQVTLTVIDNFGITDTDMTNATIIVPNRPPTNLIISGPTNGMKNTDYAFAFGAVDEDQDAISYRIDWGDGTTYQTDYCPSGQYFGLFHKWSTSGNFIISLTATDGFLTATSEKDIGVQEGLFNENICLLVLVLLALLVLLAILAYAKKRKNNK